MQAAAFRDKKGGNTGDHKDTHDPDYENITLTFRNRDQPRDSHLAPMNQDSEMSRELLSLKRELWNATNAAQEVQEEQRMHWRAILQNSGEAMKGISEIKIKVQSGNEKLKTVAAEITQINKNTQKILEELGKKMSTQSTPQ
ncbi:mast cell-expressed membrane protein 1 isoform X2 [Marmota marmota marmota]|uniref:mast cell-expressed membrane protein 1 isoform X2 n=1 Tax=Marmota marmota marmota TaxID=9994 RepID=UPI002093159A|nr:mast cell-expressed membrane protein 1 isoform X2 [Marmota marmota marmota]